MTQTDELVTVGGFRNTTKIATKDSGAADATEAIPEQARTDKQRYGIAEKDFNEITSGTSNSSASWAVTSAEAVNKVLRPTSVDSVMATSADFTITVPADGMWFVDNAAGSTGTHSAAVKTSASSTGVTVAAGQVAGVMTTGGTVRRLTGDTSAT